MFAAAMAFLLPVAFSPVVHAPFWTPRLVLVLVLAAVGLPRAVTLVRSEARLPAIFALLFLLVAVVSTLAARQRDLAGLGSYGHAAGLVLVAALVGGWAVGQSLDARSRRAVAAALTAAVLVNVFVALAQQVFNMQAFRLVHPAGSHGLLGNPVHLGALLAGGVALVGTRFSVRPLAWAPVAVSVGAALQVSGSRVGLVAAVAVLALTVRRWPVRRATALAGALAVGFVAAALLSPLLPERGEGTTVTSKLAGTGVAQLQQRTDSWQTALSALGERPLLGYGPGRFVEASSPYRTLRVARGDPETVYMDAHNLPVEYLVTTGPLGFVALVAFAAVALVRARGALLWFAVGILLLGLMQPQSFAVTPLAFLALGAAGRPQHPSALAPPVRTATAVLVAAALVTAARLLHGDFLLDQARLDFTLDEGHAAARVLSPWPEPAARLGQLYVFAGQTAHEDPARRERLLDSSVRWFQEAVRRDPAIATYWNNLADLQLVRGDADGARHSFSKALRRNPWSARALVGLAVLDLRQNDVPIAKDRVARAERVLGHQAVVRMLQERGARMPP